MFILSITLSGCGTLTEPTIKEGRFNFSVAYEIHGEVNTVSSVFVCKFTESGVLLDGNYIHWDSYIENSEIEELFPENHYNCIIVDVNEYGTIYLDLNLHAEYFMSEPAYKDSRSYAPYLFIEYNEQKAEELESYGTKDPNVLESYGAKIISYVYDEPIENTYKEKTGFIDFSDE